MARTTGSWRVNPGDCHVSLYQYLDKIDSTYIQIVSVGFVIQNTACISIWLLVAGVRSTEYTLVTGHYLYGALRMTA